ncbi:MAG: hypothetical protein ABJH45_08680 [Paracoccaceae bacterium]
MSRFNNMPDRLRAASVLIGRREHAPTDGELLAYCDLLEDAALVIEA